MGWLKNLFAGIGMGVGLPTAVVGAVTVLFFAVNPPALITAGVATAVGFVSAIAGAVVYDSEE